MCRLVANFHCPTPVVTAFHIASLISPSAQVRPVDPVAVRDARLISGLRSIVRSAPVGIDRDRSDLGGGFRRQLGELVPSANKEEGGDGDDECQDDDHADGFFDRSQALYLLVVVFLRGIS